MFFLCLIFPTIKIPRPIKINTVITAKTIITIVLILFLCSNSLLEICRLFDKIEHSLFAFINNSVSFLYPLSSSLRKAVLFLNKLIC